MADVVRLNPLTSPESLASEHKSRRGRRHLFKVPIMAPQRGKDLQ